MAECADLRRGPIDIETKLTTLQIRKPSGMIAYRKKFITLVECWENEEPGSERADIIRRFQQVRPLTGMLCREFHTILIDLSKSESALLAGMKHSTRYEIRRALTQDHLQFKQNRGKTESLLDEFCDFADRFLEEKKQIGPDRRGLRLLADADALTLTSLSDQSGQTLVRHAYHCGLQRATLLYSASVLREQATPDFRSLVGRANRLLHWHDMQHFKAAGMNTYDLGGWYHGSTDLARLRINKFKQQFGGEVVKNYICEQALTAKGKLFLKVRTRLLGDAI
jgi:lipid II:glycine glycyltransferase (peptidoglycan interpeptide bridge formation enzyme)